MSRVASTPWPKPANAEQAKDIMRDSIARAAAAVDAHVVRAGFAQNDLRAEGTLEKVAESMGVDVEELPSLLNLEQSVDFAAMAELLGDLMNLARHQGFDFGQVMDVAKRYHYDQIRDVADLLIFDVAPSVRNG